MRKIILLLLPVFCIAQKEIASEVTQVNLYPSGAQVFRNLKISLEKGENKFIVRGISNEISSESIQIKLFDENLSISDLTYQSSYLSSDDLKTEQKRINDLNQSITSKKAQYLIDKKVLEREEALLLQNQTVGGTYSGMKPEDLKMTVDFFKSRMQSVLREQEQINFKLDSLNDQIKENQARLNALLSQQSNRLSEISFTVNSQENLVEKLVEISYFTLNAGWSPVYDIKANDLSQPITILYKAEMFQYSGEDWKNMDLTLNNLLPKRAANVPELQKWVWGTTNDYSDYFDTELSMNRNLSQVSGLVIDSNDGTGIAGCNVVIKGTSLGTITDQNGFYRINIPPDRRNKDNTLTFSFIGYQTQEHNSKNIPAKIELVADTNMLEEVVVSGYGSVSKKSLSLGNSLSGRVAGVNVNSNIKAKVLRKLIEEEEAPSSIQFKLDKKTTLLSNGKETTLELKEIEVPAYYQHTSVPKIDPSVFVSASIINWEELNLLPGKASLYLEGTYLGQMDLSLPDSDTLQVSLGRDPGVLVERKLINNQAKNKVIGGDTESSFHYQITVRNTKTNAINLKLIDQFPVSSHKEVSIFDKTAPNARENADSGELTWQSVIEPKSTVSFPIKYSVKYPKSGFISE